MNAPEQCPHCGAKRCPDSGDFECDLLYYDGNSSQRAAECYETEIARLKAENAALRAAVAELERLRSDGFNAKQSAADPWPKEAP